MEDITQNSTQQQVKRWFSLKYPNLAETFGRFTGEQVLKFSEAQIKEEVPGITGSAIYNDLHPPTTQVFQVKERCITDHSEGIDPLYGPITRRMDTIGRIKTLLNQNSVIHLSSPPYSGKTSLAVLLSDYFISIKVKVKTIKCNFVDKKDSLEKWFFPAIQESNLKWMISPESILQNHEPKVIIFDDAQELYSHTKFWTSYVKVLDMYPSCQLKFIMLSTFHSEFKKNSPYACSCRLYPDFLVGTTEEMKELYDDYDSLSKLEPLGDFRECLSRLSSNNIPYTRQMLIYLYEYCWKQRSLKIQYKTQDLVRVLLGYKFYQRISSLRNTIDVYLLPEEERELILLMIRENRVLLKQLNDITVRSLVKKGVIIGTKDGECKFASPLMYRMVFNQLVSPESRPSAAPADPVTLVLQCLPLFNSEWLKNTLGRRVNDLPLEDTWQKEFFRVAGTQIPFYCTLSTDVGHTFGNTIKAVDFYVDGKLQWMIEFVSEGDRLQEHLDRFALNGRYSLIPTKEFLVVDFRNSTPRELRSHVLYVIYNEKDYASAVVKMEGMDSITIKFSKPVHTVSQYLIT